MDLQRLKEILNNVEFGDEKFVASEKGDGFLIQLQYMEPDIDNPTGPPQLQKARKWYISSHVSESEIVQTCLLACLTSMEHRTRERFKYLGARLYGPHIDVYAHREIANRTSHRPDHRVVKDIAETLPCGCNRRVLAVQDGWKPHFGQPTIQEQEEHATHMPNEVYDGTRRVAALPVLLHSAPSTE